MEKFNLSKYFPESFGVHFFPEDSEAIMIGISPLYDGRRAFSLEIWNGRSVIIDDVYSWEIDVGTDDDILARALTYVCIVAKAAHNGKLPGFISKMNMLNG